MIIDKPGLKTPSRYPDSGFYSKARFIQAISLFP